MSHTTRFVSLNRHIPTGRIEPDHFTIQTKNLPNLTNGQLLLRPIVFSLDATLRGQLTGQEGYFLPQIPLGEAITGIAVSEVVESRHPNLQPGDRVLSQAEWADLSVWPPRDSWLDPTPLDPRIDKPSHALGVFGLLGGLTAHTGIIEAGQVRAGETVVVSAAAGNVGSLAGQIARIRGARVIGLAGSQQKRALLTERLGFDAALDYRAPDLAEQLRAFAPAGPDLYFDAVGGEVSQTVMGIMRRPARVIVCGLISTYDHDTAWTIDIRPIYGNGLTLQGFTPLQFPDALPAALDDLVDWVRDGALIPLETERRGLDALPGAISGLFRGENIGKMIVTVP
ncbi:MDR family NADP-dependent oxidoreductase [Actinocatenispora rupis]|uniref:NADP-dependent oxidoreductase n=1 Tax=Actinocatenispora rupis TaxID=519421 RepID=A0A8J3NAY2_9ACTN|nr:NADP-dependent oxidoreductase [Actinocatenispora rupis]GID10190.1 NADP-dependent oxidoreductase [Actinocatenispora rupis]